MIIVALRAARLCSFEEIAGEDGAYEGILKKEALQIERKRQKLNVPWEECGR